MYRKHKGSKEYVIMGISTWRPPVGMVYNIITNQYERREILSRSSRAHNQYWERPEPPKDYELKRKKEIVTQRTNPEYYNPELQEYRNQEWDRRLNGFWFYNNGKPTYVTGLHYFYLVHWKIDVGYPDFRITDMEFFYFLEYVMQDPNCLGMIEVTKRRQGKCFAKGTKIRMYDGSVKNVENIVDGDLVMGDDSTPRAAYGITSGQEEMFEITPAKGSGFICNKSHILSLVWNGVSTHSKYGWAKNDVVNISVEEYLSLKNWEKEHLVMYRKGWGNNFKEITHKLTPYMLGVYLGDGSSLSGDITSIDPEIRQVYEDFAKSIDYRVVDADNVTFRISKNNQKGNNIYRDSLREINVLKNKHIPKEYLIDSRQNRLELLAGLLDTDGSLNVVRGNYDSYEITQKNKRLAENILELARSLGFYASFNHRISKMKRKDGSIYSCETYRIRIYGELNLIPCKIERKKCPTVNRRVDSLRFGFKINSVGLGDYYGFAVGKNHLFLLEDGTVVHNTMRAGAFLFELTSRSKNKNAGIQSKTFDDAKDNVFAKGIVMPFKYLPDFFVPIYDTEKGMTPKGELRFFKTNKRGAVEDSFAEKVELESTITFKSSDKFAYDGMKIHRYLADEAGKTKNVDVYERHQVVQFCLQQEETIIGKALYTTTVEEMEDGGSSFKQLWKASDQNHKNANGRTMSGLYQYFMPAYRTLFYDKYGYADEEKSKKFYLAERAALEVDPRALASFIRKNPFTIEEAFFSEADTCLYDAMKINRQIESITWVNEKELYLRGEFVWENGERDTRVLFKTSSNGKFLVHSKVNPTDAGFYNQVENYGTKKVPKNTGKFAIGCDPFDHSITVSKERSDGAAYVYRKFDALDELSETFLVEYLNRPDKAEIFYEDMIKLAHFFGCELLSEDNKVGLIKYFEYRGYDKFLMKMPGSTKFGVSASVKMHQQIAEQTETYIEENIHKVVFKNLLDDWLHFDINKTTKFDAAMASGYTLIAASKSKFAQKIEQKQNIYDVREIFLF